MVVLQKLALLFRGLPESELMFVLHQYESESLTAKMNTADAPSEEEVEPVLLLCS